MTLIKAVSEVSAERCGVLGFAVSTFQCTTLFSHLHLSGCECRHFLGHARGDATEHGGAARQHNVPIELLVEVVVALRPRGAGDASDGQSGVAHV